MGRKKANASRTVYNRIMMIPGAKSVYSLAASAKRIKLKGAGLINPSVGKLRAWADPVKGVSIVMGVSC